MSETTAAVTYKEVPTVVKYAMLRQGHAAPAPAPEPKKSKKKNKKNKKKGKGQQLAVREPPIVDTPNDAQFGDLRTMQSRFKTDRVFTPVSELSGALAGSKVWVRARVETVRGKGKSSFMVLRRGFSTVQGSMFAGEAIPREMVKYSHKIPRESVVDVYGEVAKPPQPTSCTQSEVELQVERIYVVSVAIAALPFSMEDAQRSEAEIAAAQAAKDAAKAEAAAAGGKKKNKKKSKAEEDDVVPTVGLSTRLDQRWVDLRTPANHAIFRLQSGVSRYFREYFQERDFVEIHTPKITPGVSEGGSEVFRLEYFGRPACLAQSPQLFKQMASACSDLFRVFEIGPVFRAENSNTHRHLCEFVGLDFEMEIVEHYHEVLKVLGDMFVFVFDQLNAHFAAELEAVNKQYPYEPLKYRKETLVIPHRQAVEMINASLDDPNVEVPEGVDRMDYMDDFTTRQEKWLGKLMRAKYDTDFYIVDRYPLSARPFYTMPAPDDPNYTNSYDVFLRGEEITSGAQRVHEVALLCERATACEIPLDNITAYIEAFKYGAPPHGGAGIGLERVVMLFLGLPNIRYSSMFPRDPTRVEP